MRNEVKLWLAGELGLEAHIAETLDGNDVFHSPYETISGPRSKLFDIESDTPDAAYLREKALKMLVSEYEFGWRVCNEVLQCELRYALGDGFYDFEADDIESAIAMAWCWLYERREA